MMVVGPSFFVSMFQEQIGCANVRVPLSYFHTFVAISAKLSPQNNMARGQPAGRSSI